MGKPTLGAPTIVCQSLLSSARSSFATQRVLFPSAFGSYTKDAEALREQIRVPMYAGITCHRGTKVGARWKGGHCTSQGHRGPGLSSDPPAPAAAISLCLTFVMETVGGFGPGMDRHRGPWRDVCLCFDVSLLLTIFAFK